MTPPLTTPPEDAPAATIAAPTILPDEPEAPLSDDPRTPPIAEEAALLGEPMPVMVELDEAGPPDLGPIPTQERIAELDILRGFALLGICVINLQTFLGPHGITGDTPLYPAWYDRTAEFLINLFGSGKFNAMFSFLFGVGFAIQMERAAAKGAGFASMYVRRLLALLVFGALHLIFLWEGDVLHVYALIGLPLVFCRKLRDLWMWCLVVLTLVGPMVFVGLMVASEETQNEARKQARIAAGESREAVEAQEKARSEAKKEIKAREVYDHARESLDVYGRGEYLVPPYMPLSERKRREEAHITAPVPATVPATAHPSYLRGVKFRMNDWVRFMREGMAVFWAILGTTLLIGFIAGRRRIFQEIPKWQRFIRWTTIVSGVIGLGISLVFATASLLAAGGMEEGDSPVAILAILAYILGRPFLCAFYMGVLVMMAQTERFGRVLAPLALVGRMPLTNYLMHSVVFSTLFYGYAVGWFYRVGPAASLLVAFTLYALQVAYSNWWMRRFRFGPMEWLWRTMTYGKAPALRLPAPASA